MGSVEKCPSILEIQTEAFNVIAVLHFTLNHKRFVERGKMIFWQDLRNIMCGI